MLFNFSFPFSLCDYSLHSFSLYILKVVCGCPKHMQGICSYDLQQATPPSFKKSTSASSVVTGLSLGIQISSRR